MGVGGPAAQQNGIISHQKKENQREKKAEKTDPSRAQEERREHCGC